MFGIGIGYLKPEFEAIGAPFDHKGPRSEEFLAAMIALWTQEKPGYHGRFSRLAASMRCRGQCKNPILRWFSAAIPKKRIAGRRALARGWYGFALDLDGAAKCIEGLRTASKRPGGILTIWKSVLRHADGSIMTP